LKIIPPEGYGKLRRAEGFLLVTIRDMVLGLLDLPGSRYSCVAERESGQILIESGVATVDPAVVLRWGTEATTVLEAAADGGLEDVILTSGCLYHLVRPLGASRSLLVYLCVDRARANLASARRELAAARFDDRVVTVAAPRPPPESLKGLSPAISRPASAMPPASVPPARQPVAATTNPAAVAVPLPRRAGPRAIPGAAPPPQQRWSSDPVLGRQWANDVVTMSRLLTALRSWGSDVEST
jgi:hypothetical protein